MKIHAWNSQPVSQVSSVPKAFTDSTPPPAGAISESPPSHIAVSGPGQLISKLMQLKQEDPDKFQEVVSGLATSLKETAESLDGRAAKRLDSLANKLDDIATGGDIGQLARRDHMHHHAPHHGHHPGHHHGHRHGFGRIDGDGHGFPDRDSVLPGAESPSEVATSEAATSEAATSEAATSEAATSEAATSEVSTTTAAPTPETPTLAPAAPEGEAAAAAATAAAAPEAAVDVHQAPTLVPPAAEDATPTLPWNPPPALLAFGRFGGPGDESNDREVLRTAFANLLQQLDAALAS